MKTKEQFRDIIFIGGSIGVITFLHYFTVTTKWGSIHDFYRLLYYIPIIVSAFKFKLKGGMIASIIISILYSPHLLVYFGTIDMATLNKMLEIVMFIVVGTITGFLVESDHRKKNMLEVQIKKLTDLENFTQNILDSITNVLIAVDKDLKIKSINKEGKKLFTIDETLKNNQLNKLFVDYHRIEKILIDVVKHNKKTLDIETKCYSQGERIVDVKLLVYPLRNILEDVQGIVIVIEDISEIRRLEGQIRRAEKLSAVGELASGVAHEIRNPMGIIKTISQTLYSELDDEDIKEGIGIIIHEIDRANLVIKGLLDFAKPSIQQNLSVSIDRIIKEILLITKKYAQQYNVTIDYDPKEDANTIIDSEKIKQAFVNIILNSIQAMPKGGKIRISLSIQREFAKISFVDNGIGIEKNNLEKIFNPFYTTKDSGTGLGLSITHRIVEEHQGFIEIQSEIGKGTDLNIYLPISIGGTEING